jgi:hypothetical protein
MLSMPVHLPESQEKSRNSDRWAASKAERVALVESAFSCGANIEPFAKNKTIEVFDVSGLLYLLERHAGLRAGINMPVET